MPPSAAIAEQNALLTLAFLPFASALLMITLPRTAERGAALLAGATMLLGLVLLAGLGRTSATARGIGASIDWIPELGLNLSFRLDGFSWLFALLVLAIGLLIVLYARYYMADYGGLPRFYALLMGFTGAMQGLLLSDNILLLVVFWELTSIMSFLLIGFWHGSQAARDGARTALIITTIGGLCLLVAMMLIGQAVGNYDLTQVLAAGSVVRADPLYGVILALFLVGVLTKSAQFPFH